MYRKCIARALSGPRGRCACPESHQAACAVCGGGLDLAGEGIHGGTDCTSQDGIPYDKTMGVFLLESRHGIHVSSRVIMPDLDYFRWVFDSFLRAKIIGQPLVPFTLEVLQLCD